MDDRRHHHKDETILFLVSAKLAAVFLSLGEKRMSK